MVLRRNNQLIVGGCGRRDDEEDAQPGWSVWRGGGFLFWGGELNDEKNYKIKYNEGLRWGRRLIFCHATTNQKYVGMTEGGWYRPCDRARLLGERDGKLRATKTLTTGTARMMTSPTTTTNRRWR